MKQSKQWILAAGMILCVPVMAQQPTITPTAKELNKSFDAESTQWAERFEHEGRAIFDKRYDILDAMHLKPGMAVADIGAGSGLLARMVVQRVGSTGTVYAVDIAKNMIDRIATQAAKDGIANLKPILGDPHSPKLPANCCDLIYIVDSYHHFEYPSDMLSEIMKALRPDGVLMVIDFKRIEGVSKDYILKMVRAGEGTFTDEFQNAGFEVIERRGDMFPENYLLRLKKRSTTAKAATAGTH